MEVGADGTEAVSVRLLREARGMMMLLISVAGERLAPCHH